ncbi:MAG: hypothetical protein PVH41_12720 [Anaerolineae bacterium]|jgi:hypothetical protein
MTEQIKLIWLKRVLFVKVLLTLFAWGLPSLLAPEPFLNLFGLSMPTDPTYLRLLGAAVTAFGVAYWFAYRDPVRNRAILQAGVVDNGLITLTVIVLAFTRGLESWFIGLSGALTGLFCLAFILLMPPRDEGMSQRQSGPPPAEQAP